MDLILPYKSGDAVEARSFTRGYRGAWFRCKISETCVRKSAHFECSLEYIDYPGQKKTWTRLYQVAPGYHKQKSSMSRQIMLRPRFPQWYRRDQVPEHCPKNDVIAVVSDTWKVGDLIDWWSDYCFWTGKITKLLVEDKVKIVLLEPPMGEGGCHTVDCKDLRPALDWSLVKGWSIPLSQANGKSWYTAYLILHNSDTSESSSDEDSGPDDHIEEVQKCLNGASDMHQEAPDSSDLKSSSNTSLNNQTGSSGSSAAPSRPSMLVRASSPSPGPRGSPAAKTNSQLVAIGSRGNWISSGSHNFPAAKANGQSGTDNSRSQISSGSDTKKHSRELLEDSSEKQK